MKWDELHLSEDPAEDLLVQVLGYTALDAAQAEAERESPSQSILTTRLGRALRKLNPWISDANVNHAIRHLTHVATPGLIEANEHLHTALTHHISLEQDVGHGKQGQTVRFIDFDQPEDNDFAFVRQLRFAGPREVIVPYLVLFVNGIPLGLIECKNPTAGDDPLAKGIDQLLRYQGNEDRFRGLGAPRLFHGAQILVATCGQATRYGTVGTPAESFLEWKVPFPVTLDKLQERLQRIPTPQDVALYSLFLKSNLLDLVRNFTVFDAEGQRTQKKLARYQQFIAVNKTIDRIRNAHTPQKRGGIIWHTQGSGKSLTMLFLAVKLRRLKEAQNPTLVMVTDRNDLDDQLTATFVRCGFSDPVQARSSKHLEELLRQGSGQTVLTTIHKFQDAAERGDDAWNAAENVFVMVDESHRTQYHQIAAHMRKVLPRACFIGFTGTPIDKRDRSTIKTFGSYIHCYNIEQAVKDHATVPIFYEMRDPQDRIEGEPLDAVFERIFKHLSKEEREALKDRYVTPEAIAGAPARIERICLDLLEHYEKFIRPNGFKAQIVACNKHAAVTYNETLLRLCAPPSALIFSASNDDEERIKKWHRSKGEQRELIRRFKDDKDRLSILIVCDMLLTGFDAPVEQVMYLDAQLREHTLLQAIARVNRPAPNKDFGLIVDYWGVAKELDDALALFAPSEIQGAMRPMSDELSRLEARHRTVMRFFAGIPRDDLEACLRVLEPDDRRAEFDLWFRRFSQSLDMLLPDPSALPYVADLKWLGQIRNAARARYRDERFNLSGYRKKVRQLIEEHIRSDGVRQVLEPISILSPEFDEEVKRLRGTEARASEIEHAIRHEIHIKSMENPVFYRSLQERLQKIIDDRRQSRIDGAEQLRLLQGIVKDLRNIHRTAEDLGLDEVAFAVYELLDPGPKDVLVARDASPSYGSSDTPGQKSADLGRRDLAAQITHDMEGMAIVDWIHKEDVQRQMRQLIKRHLRTSGYAREQIEPVTAQIMNLLRLRLTR